MKRIWMQHATLRWGLLPLAGVYGLIIWCWDRTWSLGLRRVRRLGLPVISVGSLFAGGSGKTPLVGWLAGALAGRGWVPLVLTRGYGRAARRPRVVQAGNADVDWREIGDEAWTLVVRAGVAVAVHGDRHRAFAAAVRCLRPTVVVLDDGFQARAVHRDRDVVLIDAPGWTNFRRLLPAGLLREPPRALRRADGVVLTKGDARDFAAMEAWARRYLPADRPIFQARFELGACCHLDGTPMDIRRLREAAWLVVASVVHPEVLVRDLTASGVRVAGVWKRPDHAAWRVGDLRRLEQRVRATGAAGVVTTWKDAAKWQATTFPFPVVVAEQRVRFQPSAEAFLDWVVAGLGR